MKDLSLFLLIAFVVEAAVQSARPLISLQMAAMGSLPGEIGVLFASANAVPLLLSVPLGRLAGRVGPIRVLVSGTSAACLGFVALALAPSSLAMAFALGLMQTGMTAAYVSQHLLSAGLAAPQQRGYVYGWLGTAHAAGQMLGPALGGVLADAAGTYLVFLCSALGTLVPLLIVRRLTQIKTLAGRPLPPAFPGASLGAHGLRLIANPELRQVMLVAFLVLAAFDVRNSYLPVHLSSLGFSKATIGVLFSALAFTSILIRPCTGWLTQRMGNWHLLAAATALAGPGLLLLPLTRDALVVAVVLGALGVAHGLTQPLTMTIVAGAVTDAQRGVALGMRMFSQQVSMLVSPLLLGAVAGKLGLGAALQGAGVFALLACGAAVHGVRIAMRPARTK